MKKRISLLLAAALLVLSGCSGGTDQQAQSEARLTVVATTYPVYLFAHAVTEGVPEVVIERLDTGSVSCLHDYTLSVSDMKKLERADMIALNGVELESFLEDALERSEAVTVDCAQGVALLENLSHDHSEGESEDLDHGHYDPHIWMAPQNAMVMVENLARELAQMDEEYAASYQSNTQTAVERLQELDTALREMQGENVTGLITFHDGFQYFAHAYQLPLLESIEEEAGSEASAKEITEITRLVQEHHIPVIFTEVNGSDATAQAIARETGCQVVQLTMLMDGEKDSLEAYCEGMAQNMEAVIQGFQPRS